MLGMAGDQVLDECGYEADGKAFTFLRKVN
jgi:hypothetical protein